MMAVLTSDTMRTVQAAIGCARMLPPLPPLRSCGVPCCGAGCTPCRLSRGLRVPELAETRMSVRASRPPAALLTARTPASRRLPNPPLPAAGRASSGCSTRSRPRCSSRCVAEEHTRAAAPEGRLLPLGGARRPAGRAPPPPLRVPPSRARAPPLPAARPCRTRQVKTQLTNHVLMVVPAAAIGIVCGLCAILFTIINLKVGAPCALPAAAAAQRKAAGAPLLGGGVGQSCRPSSTCRRVGAPSTAHWSSRSPCRLPNPAWLASEARAAKIVHLARIVPACFAARRRPQVARARSEFFKGRPPRWRMAEPCLLIVIFVTLGMILPLFFPCTPTHVRARAAWRRGRQLPA